MGDYVFHPPKFLRVWISDPNDDLLESFANIIKTVNCPHQNRVLCLTLHGDFTRWSIWQVYKFWLDGAALSNMNLRVVFRSLFTWLTVWRFIGIAQECWNLQRTRKYRQRHWVWWSTCKNYHYKCDHCRGIEVNKEEYSIRTALLWNGTLTTDKWCDIVRKYYDILRPRVTLCSHAFII